MIDYFLVSNMTQNFQERFTGHRIFLSSRDITIGAIAASIIGVPIGLHLHKNVLAGELAETKPKYTAAGITIGKCVGSNMEDAFSKKYPDTGYTHGNGILYDVYSSMHYSFMSGIPASQPSDKIHTFEKLASEGKELRERLENHITGLYERALSDGIEFNCFFPR